MDLNHIDFRVHPSGRDRHGLPIFQSSRLEEQAVSRESSSPV